MSESESFAILLVDDQPENLILLERTLAAPGISIAKARCGEDAMALLEGPQEFSVAFLDVQMPGMDGFELATRMRQSDRLRSIPVIFVTATSIQEHHIFKGYESGAVDYMFKPLDPEIIRCKAAVFLELHRRRRTIETQSRQLAAKVEELEHLNKELQDAMEHIRVLRGIIPICVHCKKIRDDKGYWEQVERYIQRHSEADFSHGICPDCLRKNFPDLAADILDKRND